MRCGADAVTAPPGCLGRRRLASTPGTGCERFTTLVKLANQTPTDRLSTDLAPKLDIPAVIRFVAAQVFMAETDGFLGGFGVHRFLLDKWYFDELYDFLFVRPARRAAMWLWKVGDAKVIDGMPNGAAALTASAAGRVTRFQTGRVANYAFTMIVGLVLFVSIFLFGIGR